MEIINKEGFAIIRFIAARGDANFQYIVWCKETREAAVIDPLDVRGILSCLESHRLRVRYIINTHTHLDHTEGNNAILKVSLESFGSKHSARVIVHESALRRVAPRSEGVGDGDTITVGNIEIGVLHTPGHTPEHISLVAGDSLFSGDTLFLAGCGNVKYGGNIDDLYDTFSRKISTLPDGLEVHPGHDYGERNLGFALYLTPGNKDAKRMLEVVKSAKASGRLTPVPTLGDERRYNPFLRVDSPEVAQAARTRAGIEGSDSKEIFRVLRELRDKW